jgi:hypothetical protein
MGIMMSQDATSLHTCRESTSLELFSLIRMLFTVAVINPLVGHPGEHQACISNI